jgi:hypothetical protein
MAKNATVMKRAMVLVFLAGLAVPATAQEGGFAGGTISASTNYFYVDVVHGSDDNEGLTPGTAFATIRKAVATASGGDVIRVFPGLYREEIDFKGKAVVVQGVAAGPAGVPVIHNPNDFAVSFYNGEGPDSILRNFIIKDNFMAVFISGSSPTISNLTIVGNMYGIEASDDSQPDISNIIFWDNIYSDLFGCQARYSRIDDAGAGQANIEDDPLFVDPKSGDYRLLSNRGRYWSEHNVWVLDRLTSPCIDGGDPNAETLDEPIPNGGRINMGAYGGTAQASLSLYGEISLPGQASNPNPANGAIEVDRYAQLSWTPGLDAVGHNVYFGTENPPPRVSSQSMNQFNPGIMDRGTVYYWRVDEIDSKGNLTAGVLWRFTTNFGSAPPPPKGRTCFTGETGVWADGNLVAISNVAARASVGRINAAAAKDSSISLPYLGKVEELQEHQGTFECYDVLLKSGNRISVAENHYFLAQSGQWLALRDLKAGTKLRTATGSIEIESVTRRPTPYTGKVYNLKVEGSDRYLVGKDAIVVRDY